MYKLPKHPKIIELTKSVRERSFTLSNLKAEPTPTGRFCVWCNEVDLGTRKNKKYCSEACRDATWAWAYPQSEHGAGVLLARQGFLCAACGFDWNPLADGIIGRVGVPKSLDRLTQLNVRFIKILKNRCPRERRIEIDHVIAISLGGESLGLANHQAICTLCHKAKTKIDAKKRANKKIV